MTTIAWANLYICANILLAASVVLLRVPGTVCGRFRQPVAYKHRLAFGRTLLVAAMLLPLGTLVSPQDGGLPRTAQVWSAPTMRDSAADGSGNHRIGLSVAPAGTSMSLNAASDVAVGLLLIGLLISVTRLGRDIKSTRQVIDEAQRIRRRGRLSILVSEQVQVPFSFWWPGQYFVVVPSTLVLHPADLRMAILHEAQHHRQQDTKWLYLYQLLKALFFWNPAVHGLERHLRALQEFACDEALSTRRSVVVQEYCRSLLRVAEGATTRRAVLHASMSDGSGSLLLKRRVEAVLLRPETHQRPSAVVAAMLVASSVLVVTALGCSSSIQDRRISEADAAGMALARADSALPIVVNHAVVRQLNLMLATPDGRAYAQESLDRMQSFEKVISAEIARYELPPELLAVPLVESGYRNLPPDEHPTHGAGLWMFIEPTASRFGLTVDASRDDRLDVAAETRAAMEYFARLYRHFGDWGLAILAYNAGVARVEEGIRAAGSRDVWEVIAEGYENDTDYLPRVIAAVLILQNPSVVE